jgi:hypothetical protein
MPREITVVSQLFSRSLHLGIMRVNSLIFVIWYTSANHWYTSANGDATLRVPLGEYRRSDTFNFFNHSFQFVLLLFNTNPVPG